MQPGLPAEVLLVHKALELGQHLLRVLVQERRLGRVGALELVSDRESVKIRKVELQDERTLLPHRVCFHPLRVTHRRPRLGALEMTGLGETKTGAVRGTIARIVWTATGRGPRMNGRSCLLKHHPMVVRLAA